MRQTTGMSEAIARVVRETLAGRRIDIKTFAEKIPGSVSSVYRWVNGEIPMVTDTVEHMAHALGMDVVELVRQAVDLRNRESAKDKL